MIMICPNCNRTYKEGTLLCPKCHVTLTPDGSHTDEAKELVLEDESRFAQVLQTWDCYEFLDVCNVLKNAGIDFIGNDTYTGELRVDGQGRGQAPYIWKIYVPVEQKDNALTLLAGRMAANAGYADAGLKPLKREQRPFFWIVAAIVALAWAVIIWKLNF
jgi:hypothetical protein